MQHKIVSPSCIPHDLKIVLCQGCFDLLHVGHIKHLTAAKQFGDILVVAVTSDRYVNKGPGRPYFNQDLRMEQLAALEIVDYVVLSDAVGAENIIGEVRPDFFVKGDEYENSSPSVVDNMTSERAATEAVGGRVVFTHDQVFSSSEIINKVFSPLTQELREFMSNGRVDKESVLGALEAIKNLKVLVVGDTILDEYCFVKSIGMATKQSYVSSRFINKEIHLGGAIATARHISKLCDNVTLFTSVDADRYVDIQRELMPIYTINMEIPETQVISKTRFIDESNRILFRVDVGDDRPRNYIENINSVISIGQYDLVVVNDFGHGLISNDCAKYLSGIGDFLCVNTQSNNMNRGFNLITKYQRADYISLDLPEIRLATGDKFSDVDIVANQLAALVPYKTLSVTKGKNGAWVRGDSAVHIPAFSADVVDTTGAGDAYFSVTSLLAKIGAQPAVIGFIGNAVASLKTRILGNRHAIDQTLLKKYLIALLK